MTHPCPCPCPKEALSLLCAIELNHRDTETRSHRTEKPQIAQMNADSIAHRNVATTKTRRHEGRKVHHSNHKGHEETTKIPQRVEINSWRCGPVGYCRSDGSEVFQKAGRRLRHPAVRPSDECDGFPMRCFVVPLWFLCVLRGENPPMKRGTAPSRARPLESARLSVSLCVPLCLCVEKPTPFPGGHS